MTTQAVGFTRNHCFRSTTQWRRLPRRKKELFDTLALADEELIKEAAFEVSLISKRDAVPSEEDELGELLNSCPG